MFTRIGEATVSTKIMDKVLYTIPELVKLTGYSRSFIYQAITDGSLKVRRKGRTIRVSIDSLNEWISSDD